MVRYATPYSLLLEVGKVFEVTVGLGVSVSSLEESQQFADKLRAGGLGWQGLRGWLAGLPARVSGADLFLRLDIPTFTLPRAPTFSPVEAQSENPET
jgi:hypothetical protein